MKHQPQKLTEFFTRKVLWLSSTGILALWLGFLFESPQLVILSVVVVLYIAISRLATYSNISHIEVNQSLDRTSLFEREEVKFTSTFSNSSSEPAMLEILDQIPQDVRIIQGGNHYPILLEPYETASFAYKLKCEQKGHFVIKPSRIRLLDPFGLKHHELELGNSVFLKVLPTTEDVRGFRLTPKSVHLTLGAARAKQPGIGTEFFGLREYLPGDEFRRINWKASARIRKLMSNEYEWEQVVDVYILLDATPVSEEIFRASVRAAASLANNLVKGRNRVGLIIYSDTISFVSAEAGSRQLLKIIEKLIDSKAREPFVFDAQIAATTHLVLPYSYVILISPLLNEKILSLIEKLRSLNSSITVVSPSPLSETVSIYFEESIRDVAREILTLRRQSVVTSLRGKGIEVLDWDPTISLRTVMGVMIRRPVRS